VESTGTIFELDEIETFRKSTPRQDELRHISIKMHRNDVCATVEKPHLPYSAPDALIDCIAVIHMERRVG
jgi:hypothetical protein